MYVESNPLVKADPTGLYAIPGALTAGEGLINFVGSMYALYVANSHSGAGGTAVNPVPGELGTVGSPFECSANDPEDPCEVARQRLQKNRDWLMYALETIEDSGVRARTKYQYARTFNPIVKQHNAVCPGYYVAPIEMGPVGIP